MNKMQESPPEPGAELDRLFLCKIEGFPRGKAFLTEYGWYYIPSGKPRRTHMIDAVPVPRYSTDDNVALAALERFVEKQESAYCIMRDEARRYSVTLYRDGLALSSVCAGTLAHAAVLAMLEYGP